MFFSVRFSKICIKIRSHDHAYTVSWCKETLLKIYKENERQFYTVTRGRKRVRKREREGNNLKSASVFFAPTEMKRTGFRVLSPSGRTVRRATIRLAEFDGKILLPVAVFRILLSLLYFPRLVYVSFNRAAAFITDEIAQFLRFRLKGAVTRGRTDFITFSGAFQSRVTRQ